MVTVQNKILMDIIPDIFQGKQMMINLLKKAGYKVKPVKK